MARIRIIHRKPEEISAEVRALRQAGHQVDRRPLDSMDALRRIRKRPPDAIIIDLSRIPSQGRDIGLALRQAKSTRHVPLIFAGGLPEKVEKVQAALPDAEYTPW